jgi:hypothetical protein
MVDRRPRIWRSRRNVIVLLFIYLIRRSDGSRMNSLLSAVGYLFFSYKTCTVSSPIISLRLHFSCLLCTALLPPHRREQNTLVTALLWLHLCSWLSRGKRRGREEGQLRKICVALGEEEIHPLSFFPLWIYLYLDSILVQITKSKLQPFCSVLYLSARTLADQLFFGDFMCRIWPDH